MYFGVCCLYFWVSHRHFVTGFVLPRIGIIVFLNFLQKKLGKNS